MRQLALLTLLVSTLLSVSSSGPFAVTLAAPSASRHPAAPTAGTPPVARVKFIDHGLGVQPPHQKLRKGKMKDPLFNSYLLRTRAHQRASIRFRDGSILNMNQQTDALLRSSHMTQVGRGEVDEIVTSGAHGGVVQKFSDAGQLIATWK